MEQPTSFFSGGFRIKGDVELTGDIIQDPIRIGEGAETLENTIGIGKNATATGGGSTSVGINSDALAQHATAYGKNAQALSQDTTAIGNETTAPANWNTVIGYDAGSFQNGENIVLIGRKSEGQGDDSVAIGENARANGLQSTAVGKATSALAKNASAFGQAASVTGQGATVVGQGVTLDEKNATTVGTDTSVTAPGATSIGRSSTASAQDSTAIGKNTEVSGKNSVAVGTGVVVKQDNTFSFGDRTISVPPNRNIVFPVNSGVATLVNFGITSEATAGSTQSYSLEINDEPLFTVASDADGTGGIQNKRTQLNGNITVDSTTLWDSSEGYIPQPRLENDSITLNGGTGLKSGSTASLGGSFSLEVEPNGFAGSGLEDDGFDNLQLVNNSITLSGGNGLKNGSTVKLGNSVSLDVEPADFAGQFIQDSGSDALEVLISNGLENDGNGNIRVSGSSLADSFISVGTNPHQLSVNIGDGIEGDGNNNIRVRGDSVSDAFLSEGSFPHKISVNLGQGVEGDGTNNIRVNAGAIAGNALTENPATPHLIDVASDSIGSGELVNDSITFTAGNGISSAGTVSLGNSLTISVDPDTFISTSTSGIAVNIGSGLIDDGTDNIRINGSAIADSFLSQGTNAHQLAVNIGDGLEGDGLDNIRVRADSIAGNSLAESTSPHIIDVKADSIGSNELVNDSITVSTGNGLSGGSTISLGNSSTLSVDTSSFISSGTQGVSVNIGNGLTGDGSNNIKVNTSELSFDASQTLFDAGIDVRDDILNNTNVIYNSTQNHIPTTILQNDSITISTGANISGGGSPALGGSGISLGLINTDITINGQNGIDGGTASLGETIDVGILGSFELDTDLKSNSTGTNVIIWDESKGYIPQNRLENDSITINTSNGLSAGSATLGQSVSIGISGNLSLDSDLQAVNGETIWSETNTHVPLSALENSSITLSTGSNLSNGKTISLGGSLTLSLNNSIALSTINTDEIKDNGQGFIDFNVSNSRVGTIDGNGNVSIKGSLNEGATL